MNGEFCVTLTREDNYRFVLDFGSGMAKTVSDEPEPVGEDTGPNPEQLLAAAVANCLAASFFLAVPNLKEDPGHLSETAISRTGGNKKNRLRVTGLDVAIT